MKKSSLSLSLSLIKIISLFFLSTILVLTVSCGGGAASRANGETAGPTVYVAGGEGYWKNGNAVLLMDDTHDATANSLFVVGNNVYIAGEERNSEGKTFSKYWKHANGEVQTITLSDGTSHDWGSSIFVSGNDVYVAGYSYSGDPFADQNGNGSGEHVAKYWKHGEGTATVQTTTLSGGSFANSIFVSGNDVYVAGHGGSSKFWKNGTMTDLSDGNRAKSIFVAGEDVYIAGTIKGSGTYSDDFAEGCQAIYWEKRGTSAPQKITLSGGNEARSIFVVGEDVYIAGYAYNGSVHTAKYWKRHGNEDLQEITLSGGGIANSIFVLNGDIYVAGYDIDSNGSFVSAKYWKNGVSMPLNGGVYATSIFVVP